VNRFRNIADRVLERIVPQAQASAAGYQYSCFSNACANPSGQYRRQQYRRYCINGSCYAWEPWSCC
jgi:hypothetical protein